MNSIFRPIWHSKALLILFTTTCYAEKVLVPDPLSHVTITAQNLVCEKKETNFVITYNNNVHVTLGDGSTLSCDVFEIVLNTIPLGSSKDFGLDDFKTARCSGKVRLVSTNRSANADSVDIDIATKECTLRGNVILQQIKQKDTDVPLITKCSKATLNLETKNIAFSGKNDAPVSTTISLTGQPFLSGKSRKKP